MTCPRSQSQEAGELAPESRQAWVSRASELQPLLSVCQGWHRPHPEVSPALCTEVGEGVIFGSLSLRHCGSVCSHGDPRGELLPAAQLHTCSMTMSILPTAIPGHGPPRPHCGSPTLSTPLIPPPWLASRHTQSVLPQKQTLRQEFGGKHLI